MVHLYMRQNASKSRSRRRRRLSSTLYIMQAGTRSKFGLWQRCSGSFVVSILLLVRCFTIFSFVIIFISFRSVNHILCNYTYLFLLPVIPLFSFARYPIWDTHFIHESFVLCSLCLSHVFSFFGLCCHWLGMNYLDL